MYIITYYYYLIQININIFTFTYYYKYIYILHHIKKITILISIHSILIIYQFRICEATFCKIDKNKHLISYHIETIWRKLLINIFCEY